MEDNQIFLKLSNYIYKNDIESVRNILKSYNNINKVLKLQNEIGYSILMIAIERAEKEEIVKLLLETGESHPELQDEYGITALMIAVEKENIEIVKLLLESGESHPEFQNVDGYTALMIAIRNDNIEIVKLLLESGESHPELQNKRGTTALMITSNIEIVKLLLETGESHPELQDKNGFTALIIAISKGLTDIVELLLESGKSHPELQSKIGSTALMIAIISEDTPREVMKLLLETGESHPELQDKNGKTALMLAIKKEDTEIVKLLLESGESHLEIQDKSGKTALMLALSIAIDSENTEIVKLLLETDESRPELQDKDGNSALIIAIDSENTEIVKLLLETGESHPELQNDDGITALMKAVYNNNTEIVELLLKTGESHPELQDKDGDNALIIAVYNDNIEIVKLLLETGNSHPELQNKDGDTPLMIAIKDNNIEISKLLIPFYDPNIRDKNGMNALELAKSSANDKILKLFGIKRELNPEFPISEKYTMWQKYCSYLDKNYKLTELKEIATNAGINIINMDKYDICRALIASYKKYKLAQDTTTVKNDIPCQNDSTLIGDDYKNIDPKYFIVDENNYCHYLLDIKQLLETSGKHPYTNKLLSSVITREGNTLLEEYENRKEYLEYLENLDRLNDIHTEYDSSLHKLQKRKYFLNKLVNRLNKFENDPRATRYITIPMLEDFEKNIKGNIDRLISIINENEYNVKIDREEIVYKLDMLNKILDKVELEDKGNLDTIKYLILTIMREE